MVVDELDSFLEDHWHLFAVMGIFGTIGIYLTTLADTTGDITNYSAVTVGVLTSFTLSIMVGFIIHLKVIDRMQDSVRLTRFTFWLFNVLLISVLLAIVSAIFRLPGPVKGVIIAITLLLSAIISFYLLRRGLQKIRDNSEKRISPEVVNLGILFSLLLALAFLELQLPELQFKEWVNSPSLSFSLLVRGIVRTALLGVFLGVFLQFLSTIGLVMLKTIRRFVSS